jgi:hypothetical protein
MNVQDKASNRFRELKVKGNQLVEKVREIIEEGNARRVIIKKDDRILLEFPLSVGVGGTTAALLLAPQLAALGALAALVSDVHVLIEATEQAGATEEPEELAPPPKPPAEPGA